MELLLDSYSEPADEIFAGVLLGKKKKKLFVNYDEKIDGLLILLDFKCIEICTL